MNRLWLKLKEQQIFSLRFDPRKYWNRRAHTQGLGSVMQNPKADQSERKGIAKILRECRDANSVLDYGCGIGRFFGVLKNRFKRVYATDFSEEMMKRAKEENGQGVQFCKMEEFNPTDVIFCFTVLLHIVSDREWRETLQRLFGLANKYLIICETFKNNGKMILARHNRLRTLESYLESMPRFEWCKFYPKHVNNQDVLIIKKHEY